MRVTYTGENIIGLAEAGLICLFIALLISIWPTVICFIRRKKNEKYICRKNRTKR